MYMVYKIETLTVGSLIKPPQLMMYIKIFFFN